VPDVFGAPLGDHLSQRSTQTERIIRFMQPQQPTVGGELAEIEAGIDREGQGGTKGDGGERLRDGTSPGEDWFSLNPTPRSRRPVSPS
jgi:hypothetical protein